MMQDHPLSPEKPGLRNFSLHPEVVDDEIDLDAMGQDELLVLRARIDSKITGLRLSDVNLPKEALMQLQAAKALQAAASKKDTDIPMNQRAQVQNSISGIIKDLAKLQMQLYDSEYVKRLKSALVKVLKEMSPELQERFYELLEDEDERIEAEMGS
jgi:ParB-like chromosome segregation protein Spo0J